MVLNHLFKFVGITSTQRLRDKDFNPVLPDGGSQGSYPPPSNVKLCLTIAPSRPRFEPRAGSEGRRDFSTIES